MSYLTNPTGCFNIQDPPMDPFAPFIVGYCFRCKGEIYQGEPTIIEDGKRMCVDCFRANVESILRCSPAILAECMGMRYEEAT